MNSVGRSTWYQFGNSVFITKIWRSSHHAAWCILMTPQILGLTSCYFFLAEASKDKYQLTLKNQIQIEIGKIQKEPLQKVYENAIVFPHLYWKDGNFLPNVILKLNLYCIKWHTSHFFLCTECFKRNVSENANGSCEKTNNARRVKICVWQP